MNLIQICLYSGNLPTIFMLHCDSDVWLDLIFIWKVVVDQYTATYHTNKIFSRRRNPKKEKEAESSNAPNKKIVNNLECLIIKKFGNTSNLILLLLNVYTHSYFSYWKIIISQKKKRDKLEKFQEFIIYIELSNILIKFYDIH